MQTEAQIQTHIRNVLITLGYTVMEIGKTRQMVSCKRCGNKNYATGWQGNTPGAPDIIVNKPSWANVWLGIEIKKPGGAIRTEQKRLLNAGSIVIARSVQDALAAVADAESRFGFDNKTLKSVMDQLSDEQKWRSNHT